MSPASNSLTRQPFTSVTDTPSLGSPLLSPPSITLFPYTTLFRSLYQFWILPPGSSTWQVKQAYSSSNTFTWDTTGLNGGKYFYTAWARDASSTAHHCASVTH